MSTQVLESAKVFFPPSRQRLEPHPGSQPVATASSCPPCGSEGKTMLEKMLELTLPIAIAIGFWIAVALPWSPAA